MASCSWICGKEQLHPGAFTKVGSGEQGQEVVIVTVAYCLEVLVRFPHKHTQEIFPKNRFVIWKRVLS